ncbi:beta-eliminating lyase-related protein, partial [Burkholderia sp.]|uniref:beta-eliminating lyase-related protein n=1 Tax=Burkholderia sp. TaxID=36773 RepID=UPI0025C729D6
ATGTAANCLALSTLCPPHGGVVCHREAHIEVDEGGAAKARPAEPVAIRPSAPVGKSPAAAMQDARVMPAPRAAVVSKPVRKPAAAAHAASPAATTAGADDWETF